MTRYEFRWARRHPGRWIYHWWFHILVASTMIGIGLTWTYPVFEIVLGSNGWPMFMVFVGALVFATTLAPFADRLLAFTGASMITLGILRALALGEIALVEDGSTQIIAISLGLHALLLAALGLIWPSWTEIVGAGATVEAGREEDRV